YSIHLCTFIARAEFARLDLTSGGEPPCHPLNSKRATGGGSSHVLRAKHTLGPPSLLDWWAGCGGGRRGARSPPRAHAPTKEGTPTEALAVPAGARRGSIRGQHRR